MIEPEPTEREAGDGSEDKVRSGDNESKGFDLLYEEGPCLVVSKPGGLLTQSPPGIDSLERRIKSFIKERDSKPGKVYLGVPHRLDRPASGALVFARHVRAARRLAEQFQGRLVRKVYWAIVQGRVNASDGGWRDFVRKVPDEARAEIASSGEDGAKEALLQFRVVERRGELSWLEIELQTGRTHQIRLQAGSRNLPLLGDSLYGATLPFGPVVDDPRDRWIALHARRLEFEHPMLRTQVAVEAPLPDPWRSMPFEGIAACFD